MTERTSFPDNFWLDRVVEFEKVDGDNNRVTTQWQIEKKLEEKHHLGSKEDWEDFNRKKPMMAIARFNCVNASDPSEYAFMKVIPYAGSEFDLPSVRAAQALPNAKINEETSLVTLTKRGCKSSPPLRNRKREIQDDSSPFVPTGFIVYLVTDVLPGTILERDDYWKLDYNERTKIRLAFKAAYEDCLSCGIVHTFGFLGTNLLWDNITQTISILGFRNSKPATKEDAWDDNQWVGWGFGRRVKGLRKHAGPLPQNMIRGRRDKEVYEL
ncbi:hypothetical protein UA08_06225 [Talaromyces atroroseus]|uniref:Protein kinase domain-containing protein n=1 Tax=Talaromyces atroroseus TaxID=1441469 RepID=A0A225AVP9_TALAT|nr:hypothetical protein UA08_06225 [Talaromyces atroroseus]OKL58505.1 hypothetical protein UA08_06225 [Talaromyces atroroseus]